ncbi:hypothetical protein JCM31271_21830 [Halorubrum trueperi]
MRSDLALQTVIREFVQEVVPLSPEFLVALSDFQALFLPVIRPSLFPRERSLFTLEAFALVLKLKRSDCSPVRVVGVLENPNINPILRDCGLTLGTDGRP